MKKHFTKTHLQQLIGRTNDIVLPSGKSAWFNLTTLQKALSRTMEM
jgi:hypothetical protein